MGDSQLPAAFAVDADPRLFFSSSLESDPLHLNEHALEDVASLTSSVLLFVGSVLDLTFLRGLPSTKLDIWPK